VVGGLLAYYESQGFAVYSIPVDPGSHHPLIGEFEQEQLYKTFQLSSKPVLIHCAAGESRTSKAVEHLLDLIS